MKFLFQGTSAESILTELLSLISSRYVSISDLRKGSDDFRRTARHSSLDAWSFRHSKLLSARTVVTTVASSEQNVCNEKAFLRMLPKRTAAIGSTKFLDEELGTEINLAPYW